MYKKFIPIIFLSLILFSFSYAEKWGKVSFVIGKVTINHNGNDKTANINMSVDAGDNVLTGSESSADITQEGHDNVIKIIENSNVLIKDNSTNGNTILKITDGEIICNFKNLVSGRKAQFQTPTATAAIRGTALSLSYSKSLKQTTLNVFSGTVDFTVGGKLFKVPAGKKLLLENGTVKQTGASSADNKQAQDKGGDVLKDVTPPPSTDENKTIEETPVIETPIEETPPPVSEKPAEQPATQEPASTPPEEIPTTVPTDQPPDNGPPLILPPPVIPEIPPVLPPIENVGGGPNPIPITPYIPKNKVIIKVFTE